MTVDSFKFLPRSIARFYQLTDVPAITTIPWTPAVRPLAVSRLALLSSGGLYHAGSQRPFDVDRERQAPQWGDPSYRVLDMAGPLSDLAVSHLHYNPAPVMADTNVLVPRDAARAMIAGGDLGSLAPSAYSLMGYQGYPPDVDGWARHSVPGIVAQCRQEAVDVVLLVPT
jgi:hypothetical protein